MKNYFESAHEMKEKVREWLETHGIKAWDDRFLSDEELDTDEEPEAFYVLEQNLLRVIGYQGELNRLEAMQLLNLLDKFCSGEKEAGHCPGCSGCPINDGIAAIHRSSQMDPDCIADDDKPEFFGRLIDTVEDWLADYEFEPKDFPNEDRDIAIEDGEDPEELAIIYGDEYDILADAFAEVVGITR